MSVDRRADAEALTAATVPRADRAAMVGWFDPPQLLRTGLATLVSTLVGRRSDARVTLALAARGCGPYDLTTAAGPDGLWLDYVCDTGDGWNPTYAVAWTLAQPELMLTDPAGGAAHRTRRADLLVFGGDQVYPAPSRAQYQRRLVTPYALASGAAHGGSASAPAAAPAAATAAPPQVYAIPGNHDWYDGLAAFMRLFCTDVGGRGFGAWRTRQERSYFALRLPAGWWLLGVDSQLQADLDVPQIEYFREIADTRMQPGDRAILCLAQPTWVYAHKYRRHGGRFDETDLLYLREQVFAPRGVEVCVFLAGDLHHYRRHEELAPPAGRAAIQKITAGGGGAFVHPTHDEDVARIAEEPAATPGVPREFALRASYPEPATSRRLAWRNLGFAWLNPTFGVVPAVLYVATAWLFSAAVESREAGDPLAALERTGGAFLSSPGLALWVALVAALFVLFTDTASRPYKILGGLAHAGAHGLALFVVGWGAGLVAGTWLPEPPLANFAVAGLLVFAGGWLLGSAVTGLYLLVSLNAFGRHSQEAFASLRIQDWKHFLRLHVAPDGRLTIYPVGIERVPRRWRARRPGEASPSAVQPDEPLVPGLIEPPIVVGPTTSGAGTRAEPR